MAFNIDRQTINDLKIFGGKNGNDIYSIYNRAKTRGGAKLLKDMFLYPRSREGEITSRVETIRYFVGTPIAFPFSNEDFSTIEFYLSNTDERSKLTAHGGNLQRKFGHAIGSDTAYKQIHKGVTGTLQFLAGLKKFVSSLGGKQLVFLDNARGVDKILGNKELEFAKGNKKINKLPYVKTVALDKLFRFTVRREILKLLYCAYEIDVFISVAGVANDFGFSFAEIDKGGANNIEMYGVYHPLVPGAVDNDIVISEDKNVIFLTGANMAGKSTFMKAFSIAIYLAHIGFPVPARKMRFSIQEGMFTTINLADNLNMGFSHFYAEVSRVKKVAESVTRNSRLVVVFDELFRGTNVKDAYDATVAIVDAFANKHKCTFIISTHIIEAGVALREMKGNIRFVYLPTVMVGNTPGYTYKVKEGVTNDRHGMLIIQNEKILEILGGD